jgi:hypothetical protein
MRTKRDQSATHMKTTRQIVGATCWSTAVSLSVCLVFAACTTEPRTCLYEDRRLPDSQYDSLFPRDVVVRSDDPKDQAQRETAYKERLDRHLHVTPGAETCRAIRFGYGEGGAVRAIIQCDVKPPLTIQPNAFYRDRSPAYWYCYPAVKT